MFNDDGLSEFTDTIVASGGKVCIGVLDKKNKFHVIGDTEMMKRELQKLSTDNRRSSIDWAPQKAIPKLPMPLKELLKTENRNKMKKTASAFVRHFLEEDQQLGKVTHKITMITRLISIVSKPI